MFKELRTKIQASILGITMLVGCLMAPLNSMTVYADSPTEHSNLFRFTYSTDSSYMWVADSSWSQVDFSSGDLVVSTSSISIGLGSGTSFTLTKPGNTTVTVSDNDGVTLGLDSSKKYSVSWSGTTVTVAEYSSTPTSGNCGTTGYESNVTWAVTDTDSDGTYDTLTISGTGEMKNYLSPYSSDGDTRPWKAYKGDIKNVIVDFGVTSIGGFAFSVFTNLSSVTLPSSMTTIKNHAFMKCSNLTNVTFPSNVTEIGSRAFYECTGLTSVTFEGTVGNNGSGIDGESFSGVGTEGGTSNPTITFPSTWTTDKLDSYGGFKDGYFIEYSSTPSNNPGSSNSSSSSSSSSKSDSKPVDVIAEREALENSMPISPVKIDTTQFKQSDANVVPGTSYNLSNFTTTSGVVRGINAAVAGAKKTGASEATIYSGNPLCFNNAIIKAINDGKKDIVYYFIYKGHVYSVTIPATVDAKNVLDKAPFAGPFYIGQQLGTTKLLK